MTRGTARIAVVGNSHIAALKDAWVEMAPAHPALDITFFGAPQVEMGKMTLDHNLRLAIPPKRLDAETKDLLTRINGRCALSLARFDIVLRAGVTSPWFQFPQVIAARDVDGLRETGARERLSRAAFDAVLAALAETSRPAKNWRKWTGPALYFMPLPATSESCRGSERKLYRPHAALAERSDGACQIHDLLFDAVERVLDEENITLLRQPADTLTEAALTQARFKTGARRLRDGTPQL
ncbi:MAG: hypothetical protein AAFR17_14475, partial [Pseudomonadota bacterium]